MSMANLTADQADAIFDRSLEYLDFLAATTVSPIDNLIVDFVKWGRTQPAFRAWLDKLRTPKPTAEGFQRLETDDPELRGLFQTFLAETNAAEPTGSISELLAILFQVVAWWKSRKTKGGA